MNLAALKKFLRSVVMPLMASCLFLSQNANATKVCSDALGGGEKVTAGFTQKIKIMVYNLNNIFIKEAAIERGDDVRALLKNSDATFKPDRDLAWERRIIKQQDPDIFIGTEMHLIEDAHSFMNADRELKDKYWAFLKVGNDVRGINIVTYVKKSLNFSVKLTSHKDMKWIDPVTHAEYPLFSRDLPVLTLTRPGETKPALIVIGNHAKSKRDSRSDPESNRYRTAQYEAIKKIVEDLKKLHSEVMPIIMGGDFNTDVIKGPEVLPIQNILVSVFDSIKDHAIGLNERVTHFFFDRFGNRQGHQLDDIRVSGKVNVLKAKVVHYEDETGHTMANPATYDARAKQPSDHLPVVAEIEI